MLKTIAKSGLFIACFFLLTFCDKEDPVDFNVPFDCNSPASICSKPDSIGVVFGADDCDNGGISNYYECIAGTSFIDGSDDCTAAIRAKVDLCFLISQVGSEAADILRDQDCDGGGFSNIEECMMGFDPLRGNDTDELQDFADNREIETFLEKENIVFDSIPKIQDTIGLLAESYLLDTVAYDIYRAESGVIYFVESGKEGPVPTNQDTIVYDYTSSYLDNCVTLNGLNVTTNMSSCNTVVNASAVSDTMLMSNIVKGLREGLTYFPVSTKGKVIVPSRKAYSENNIEGIPAYSVLVFDVVVKEIL